MPKYEKEELDYNGYNYNVPLQMYDNSSKRGFVPEYAHMNAAYRYDEHLNDSFSRGRHSHGDDSSAYRWQEARGDYDL